MKNFGIGGLINNIKIFRAPIIKKKIRYIAESPKRDYSFSLMGIKRNKHHF